MTTPSLNTRQTIVQLLSNMQDGKEIRSYLQRFSSIDQSRFAVIKIGGAILQDQLKETADALAFLHTVGLTPIVIHGGGPQLDATLKERGIETPKIDGLRVTDAATMDAARDVFIGENIKLVEAVRAEGVEADGLIAGVIEADYLDKAKYGFVGEPTNVRLGMLKSIVNSGAIPILTCLGIAPGGQLLNINGDSATRAVVAALQPMKVVFLTGTGGLLDKHKRPMHSINLASDYEKLMKADWVAGGMRLKLQEIKRLLDALPLTSSVSITTPEGLVRELFTHGGSGTLIRQGEAIRTFTSKTRLDRAKTEALVESAFGRKLKSDWWDRLDIHQVYMSERYRAGAILTRIDDFIYLDKFAVTEEARGEGLSRTIWRQFSKQNPVFWWRSRTANNFNAFYNDMATGVVKRGYWTIYWIGETDFATIARNVERVGALPASFEG
ncbi:MAG: acetylglutamate kinase [Alphaproteobacteria bacterium RIFCSPHIGHO2_12_FULL_63_12]|nr:MAG: acetylglutamate kinase [Alphaproteobacteria bacterium RIFCSPHIGHO2_12_FULL_63_12]